jgi:uncharacterized membrane protein YdcZ (DUF606 family)
MQSRTTGIVLIIIGILMIAYTGFNYITTKRVVDLGPIKINKEENHPVQWSPIVGVVLLVGGIIVFARDKKAV